MNKKSYSSYGSPNTLGVVLDLHVGSSVLVVMVTLLQLNFQSVKTNKQKHYVSKYGLGHIMMASH